MAEIGVLGTGVVGRTLAVRAAEVGYAVTVGARTTESSSLEGFARHERITTGSFADAAASAPLIINATNGVHSLDALELAGADHLAGKVLLDVANELVPVPNGYPLPTATADNSLGQRIQAAYPATRVVKSLNTMNCQVMADPSLVPGDHVVFLSGENSAAKASVRELLESFGWRPAQFVDLGGIDTAAATETMMAIWMRVRLSRPMDGPPFNWAINSR